MDRPLGKLVKIDLHDYWKHEAREFTPWLAGEENLKLLGEALGLYELELTGTEQAVGDFSADIVARDSEGDLVIIENQLEASDHKHLGQLVTYASGLGAKTVVWIASQIREDHRQSLNWLNDVTGEEVGFFGLEIELWRIGNSPPAPKFNVVCQPNSWGKQVGTAVRRNGEETVGKNALRLEFWTKFTEFCKSGGTFLPLRDRTPIGNNYGIPIGKRGVGFGLRIIARKSRLDCRLKIGEKQSPIYFPQLAAQKSEIEVELGKIEWKYAGEGQKARITQSLLDADINFQDKWLDYFTWMKEHAESFYKVFSPRVKALRPDEGAVDDEAEEEDEGDE